MSGGRASRVLPVLGCVLAVLALFGLARSLLAMTYLNLRFAEQVDPLSRAMSFYAFVDEGEMLSGALVLVAIATAALLTGIARSGVRLRARTAALFAVWCLALALCAIFPTDNSPRIETFAGLVHQIAGAALFAGLPLAGLCLARDLAARPEWEVTARTTRGLAIGGVAVALAYPIARLPDLLPWWHFPAVLDLRPVSGLVQRVLFGMEVLLLVVLAVRLLRISLAHRGTMPRAEPVSTR
ncbi:uncharacterized protein DUF998 [Amycolatopsis cihanbeyliensis]|uniref:Uncharacterized protein DUF998 n=2 Tax=Amycolatopsis cihanbeyliensis TaxID=1128664 RepID=A0A542DP26_AMYCI|nr:uncharacterized protein DUF998 [Amycolatopsis cihanbeyliensis]